MPEKKNVTQQLLETITEIKNSIQTINTTSQDTKQIQQEQNKLAELLKAKTTDLHLSKETQQNIDILKKKLENLANETHEVKVNLERNDIYEIADAVSKSLEIH